VLQNDRNKKEKGYADPAEWTTELQTEVANRVSNALKVGGKVNMHDGKPRNPIGRTGIVGRGLLGKYGPNQAADALVTRFNESGALEMIAISRRDANIWAMPGGMVDGKEAANHASCREFFEEACAWKNPTEHAKVKEKLEKLFMEDAAVGYVGYVDDPRNTDNAWMETSCFHVHVNDKAILKNLKLEAGDDAKDAKWIKVSDDDPDFSHLYASHRQIVLDTLKRNPKFAKALKKTIKNM